MLNMHADYLVVQDSPDCNHILTRIGDRGAEWFETSTIYRMGQDHD